MYFVNLIFTNYIIIFRLEEMHQNDMKYKLEELKQACEIETQNRLAKEREEAEKLHIEELQKCRGLWEAQKEEEVETKKEELVRICNIRRRLFDLSF